MPDAVRIARTNIWAQVGIHILSFALYFTIIATEIDDLWVRYIIPLSAFTVLPIALLALLAWRFSSPSQAIWISTFIVEGIVGIWSLLLVATKNVAAILDLLLAVLVIYNLSRRASRNWFRHRSVSGGSHT